MAYPGIQKIFVAVFLCMFLGKNNYAQTTDTVGERWQHYISLEKYTQPFWKADTLFDETVQPIQENGKISVKLLFKAKAILSVKLANFGRAFLQGKDWDLKDGQLIVLPQSTIPFLNKNDLVFNTYKPDLSMNGKIPGTYVLFTERPYFSAFQLAVTYKKAKGERWDGYIPAFANHNLPNTTRKLIYRQQMKVVFYGNSIEAGYNTSDRMNTPPYMPTWAELIIYKLRTCYGNQISFANRSVQGKLAGWGLDEVKSNVISETPDLVIVGFGMNDGSAQVPPDKFRQQIDGIIKKTLEQNPAAEFILISPMLANPDAVQNGIQSSYIGELAKLRKKGVVVADMTAVHSTLLKYKSYQDMTGNNVNHPNDYLARWYAQIILGYLLNK